MRYDRQTTPKFETIEVRRYTLHPGGRERLIDLFEREFIETQERCGMTPIGHYRDLDDPNAFVWFRGFGAFDSRAACLEAFYISGEAWKTHRDAANSTMIDSDDVHMLRSATETSGFDLSGLRRSGMDDTIPSSLVALSIAPLPDTGEDAFTRAFEQNCLESLNRCARRIAYFFTEPRPNAFPRLPVHENQRVFVVVGACDDASKLERWSQTMAPHGFKTTRLEPARRSLFR